MAPLGNRGSRGATRDVAAPGLLHVPSPTHRHNWAWRSDKHIARGTSEHRLGYTTSAVCAQHEQVCVVGPRRANNLTCRFPCGKHGRGLDPRPERCGGPSRNPSFSVLPILRFHCLEHEWLNRLRRHVWRHRFQNMKDSQLGSRRQANKTAVA